MPLYASCKPQNIDDSIKNINDDLTKVCQWARGNGLSLNPSKSKCIITTRLKIYYTTISRLELNGNPIDFVDEVKNLGIIF